VTIALPAASSQTGSAPEISLRDYYRRPAVRDRIVEYCGGHGGRDVTCVFLGGIIPDDPSATGLSESLVFPPEDLVRLLEAGADISRSTWDVDSLLVHLDIDYQNVDKPAAPFAHPGDVFLKLEPVRAAVQAIFDELGLPMLVIMTGRGYHFTSRIPLASPLVTKLAGLAPLPSWFSTCSTRRPSWTRQIITEEHARAYNGMGLLIEHVAHLGLQRSAARSRIPVVLNGTVVGPDVYGRECTSLDLSYAGDPLDIRHIRVAFGAYQTHRLRDDITAHPAVCTLPPLVAVPLGGRTVMEVLDRGREPGAAAEFAAGTSAEIPIATAGVGKLLESYLGSPLVRFHRDFYETCPHEPERWAETYDRLDLTSMIPCVGEALMRPNDLLLKPEHLQHVTRYLMACGWHPRHIAGLVHSRYARDFEWGARWTRMDRQARAEFDVRVFAGMVETGLDQGIDFNCRSAQEKGLCPGVECTHDLRHDRQTLLGRVRA
jgi:hypothetical protein